MKRRLKHLPVGVDDFRKMVDKENEFLYVDKSLFIQEIMDDRDEVTLITRPRRWGKTLNLSMLYYFFSSEVNGESTKGLFSNLKISKVEDCMKGQGKYPAIFLSLKDIKESSFKDAITRFSEIIRRLFRQNEHLLANISKGSIKQFTSYLEGTASPQELSESLYFLTEMYFRHSKQRCYLLIDEYDTPLNKAYENGYIKEMSLFMSNLLGSALKTNSFLKKGILTGVLRIAKESLFSGLNNFSLHTLFSDQYTSHFGFNQEECKQLLSEFSSDSKEVTLDGITDWYNGYESFGVSLYNPWSIICCLSKDRLGLHWVNTSEDALVKRLLIQASPEMKQSFQDIMNGDSEKVLINEHIAYGDLEGEPSIWSLLLFTGYLTFKDFHMKDRYYECDVMIPNLEVLLLFKTLIQEWFQKEIGNHYRSFLQNLVSYKVNEMVADIGEYLVKVSSI
jgi:hypothetical protein